MNRRTPTAAEDGFGVALTVLLLLGGTAWMVSWTTAELFALIQAEDSDVGIRDLRIVDLVTKGPQHVWTYVNPVAFGIVAGAQFFTAVMIAFTVVTWIRSAKPPSLEGESLALLRTPERLKAWDVSTEQARRLERHLPNRGKLTAAQRGLVLGEAGPKRNRRLALGDREGTYLCLMPPRAGKTSSYAVPEIISAPGAVLVTSSKADVVETTAYLRSTKGNVWIFDPQRLGRGTEPIWWWNPLRYVETYEDAYALASKLIEKPEGGKETFWVDSARDLLSYLLYAAVIGAERDISKVSWWLDTDLDTPIEELERASKRHEAAALEKVVRGANDTVQGIIQTVRSQTSWMRSEAVMTWLKPSDKPELDLRQLVRSTDTLYMLSKEGKGSIGPLLTAMTSASIDAALEAARDQDDGRLDPPLTCVLDEAANICKIPELPSYYSYAGSAGIVIMTFLQSFAQGRGVWGEQGMTALWTAATHKIVGPGLANAKDCEDLSKLIGTTRQYRTSISRGREHEKSSTSHQWHEQPVIGPGEVAAMAPGTALLLGAGKPPVLVDQRPWYLGARATEIEQATSKNLGLVMLGAGVEGIPA